jgi:TonB family protein
MKTAAVSKIFCLILVFSSSYAAQKNDEVIVSPQLDKHTIGIECRELDPGKIVFYHRPEYPPEAGAARIGGTVEVLIKIDTRGFVESIENVTGHSLLQPAARLAATKAKFTPTVCDGRTAAVKALLIYNFIPYIITDNYFIPTGIEGFTDISKESDYFESVLFLTENYRLAFGYGDRKFHPDAPLTKGDFAHFLRLTLDMLSRHAEIADKDPKKLELYFPYNPQKLRSPDEINNLPDKSPYAESVRHLAAGYEIYLVEDGKSFQGKYPLSYNQVIAIWEKIFGKDAVPLHFQTKTIGDKLFTRGEFSLFLQETLYVLTYKVLP